MRVSILIALLLSLSQCEAVTTDDLLHPIAHIGGSYVLTHIGQMICMRTTDLTKTSCSLISGAIATGIGVAIEATQQESYREHAKSLIYNGTGVILAVGVIHLEF